MPITCAVNFSLQRFTDGGDPTQQQRRLQINRLLTIG
jgi:hypothetical protein